MADRARVSRIAHRDLDFASPLSSARVDALVGMLALPPGARVLDVGCGWAELLARVVERHDARGEGVDLDVDRGRARAAGLPPGALTLHAVDVADFRAEPGAYDLVVCVGATHLYGGLRPTLRAVAGLVRPGGQALVGDGFWARPPDAAALESLGGAAADDFADLAGTVDAATAEGFTPLYAAVSSQEEWDHYEWMWTGSLERHARERPDDPDAPALLAAARDHRDGYLRGYRGVLGFVTCLLARAP